MSLLSTSAGASIAEAADATGVSAHTLRSYERAGLMLQPVDRTSSTHRRYSDADLAWIRFLTRLRWTGVNRMPALRELGIGFASPMFSSCAG
ncbi:MerR family transcriptional regulator [Microbacterium sp. NPDC080220]|uniref:MerR family transcriptional regulator n=1 Tax=Microbacterium sp. NPDC080220 TaxID=3161017 RepID=UPI00342FBE03